MNGQEDCWTGYILCYEKAGEEVFKDEEIPSIDDEEEQETESDISPSPQKESPSSSVEKSTPDTPSNGCEAVAT